MQLHYMEAEKLVDEIGFLIVGNPHLGALDWQHLVFVANMESGRSDMSGFAYTPGCKPRPATPDDMEVLTGFHSAKCDDPRKRQTLAGVSDPASVRSGKNRGGFRI